MVAIAEWKTGDSAVASTENVNVFNCRIEMLPATSTFLTLPAIGTRAVSGKSIWIVATIFTSVTQSAIAKQTARINLFSTVARSLWRFSRHQIVDGVSVVNFALILPWANKSFIGLRCPQALMKGQFVDTYRGEIITNDEANLRSLSRTVDQENYQMDLDKFNESQMISEAEMKETVSPAEFRKIKAKVRQGEYDVSTDTEDGTPLWLNPNYQAPYVCDGMNAGGPTRFMNHSCDPNCRIFTVSYNHADHRIYDIAFFAIEEIPAGTELTFDYKDENDRGIITDAMADAVEREKGYRPARCLCNSKHCRRYFFT